MLRIAEYMQLKNKSHGKTFHILSLIYLQLPMLWDGFSKPWYVEI